MRRLSDRPTVTQNILQESVKRLSDRPAVTHKILHESVRRLSDHPTVTHNILQESVKRLSDLPRDVKPWWAQSPHTVLNFSFSKWPHADRSGGGIIICKNDTTFGSSQFSNT